MERGHLRIRHEPSCRAAGRDARACRCSPTVEARFKAMGVQRVLGKLPKGWRVADVTEFEAELAELRKHLVEGRPLRPTDVVTLRDYALAWFERLQAAVLLGQVSRLTYNTYEGDWRLHIEPHFGRYALSAIDVAMVNRYLAARLQAGAAESTAKNSLTCLSGMLTDAVAEGLLAGNPLRSPRRGRHANRRVGVDLQVRRAAPKHLQLDEALALLACVPDDHLAMVLLPLTHGLRRGEVLGLHWEWLDFGAGAIDLQGQLTWERGRPRTWTIRGCKADSERVLPFYTGASALLARRRQASGPIFTDPKTAEPYAEGSPSQLFLARAYEDAGIRRPNVLWHALRHTYSSLLIQGGIPQAEVELLMGHKIPGTTGRYMHLMHTTFPRVQAVLDEAFGAFLKARAGHSQDTAVGPESAPARTESSAISSDRNDTRFSGKRF